MLAIIQIGIDPIAFRIGGLAIHWYGIMYVVAFLVAYQFGARPHLLRRGFTQERLEQLTGWTILFGLIGARLYYDLQNVDLMKSWVDWIAVWQGGMAFYGAIIAAVATLVVLARRWRLPVWAILDAGALFAAVGQPIGRIGNVINGDILGGRSNLPWATAYLPTPDPHPFQCTAQQCYTVGVAYQPAGAYEGLATLCILAALLLLRRRGVRAGVLFIVYAALYAISQFGLDFVRESEPILWLGLKQLQLTAVVAFVVGLPLLVAIWLRTEGRRDRGQPEPAGGSGEGAVAGDAPEDDVGAPQTEANPTGATAP